MDKLFKQFTQLLASHRPARILTAMTAILVSIAWGVTGGQMWDHHRQAFDNGRQTLSLLSLSLASQMERDFQTIDLVLRDTQKVMQGPDGAKYRSVREGDELFRHYATGLPLVTGLGMYDQDGNFVANSNGTLHQNVNVADRAYFTEFLHDNSDHLFFSQPLANRINGHWIIVMARPLRNPEGFLGICGASIELSRLGEIFRQQMPLESGSVAFLRSDGVMLARWPDVPQMIGKNMLATNEMGRMLKKSDEGIVQMVSQSDGLARIYAFKALKNYPLLMVVSISDEQLYASWRHESAVSLGFCGVITAVLLFLTLMLLREMALALDREAALRVSDANLRRAQEVAHLGSWHSGGGGGQVECSDECRRILKLASDTPLTGNLLQTMVLEEDRHLLGEALAAMRRGETRELDIRIAPQGDIRWVRLLANAKISASGELTAVFGTLQDVTEAKITEEQIRFLGYYDALTGLPNRMLIRDRVERFMLAAHRVPSKIALLFLDLDNFKTINDTLGHSIGDGLLKVIAQRLRESVRESDTVARQGGDEFLIALTHVSDNASVTHVVDLILEKMGEPFAIDGHELNASFSIGVALFPDDAEDFDMLLRNADLAMYKAKDAGRNTSRFYIEEMNESIEENMHLRNGLHRALERNELQLYFQPQIRISDGAVISAEALLRWQHPVMGWVAPIRFIPVAESSGLMMPIGAWVLDEACRQAVGWQQAGHAQVGVAVNISPIQFRQGNLQDTVTTALQNSGLDPRLLELELTESILIHSSDEVLRTVRKLKESGVTFSIDDFGTGYSSLAYLKRFEVDKLKIDQSFIRDLHTDPGDAAIVRAIIQMARALKLETTAEGVETEAQREFLNAEMCDALQGYLFAKPMPADQFLLFLNQYRPQVIDRAVVGGIIPL